MERVVGARGFFWRHGGSLAASFATPPPWKRAVGVRRVTRLKARQYWLPATSPAVSPPLPRQLASFPHPLTPSQCLREPGGSQLAGVAYRPRGD